MSAKTGASGMRTFVVIWLGQMVSMIGSQITSFALGIDILQDHGSIAQFALVLVFAALPGVLVSPLAGALADRWNRRSIMLISDLGSALVSLWLFFQLDSGLPALWQVYLAVALVSLLNAFQAPAYAAAVPQLVPPAQIGRASGMVQGAQAVAVLLAQLLAGVLVTVASLQTIILIDMATFTLSVCTLLLVRIPPPRASAPTEGRLGLRELLGGWSYLVSRRGLLGLVLFLAFSNFMLGVVEVLIRPLVLGFGSAADVGIVLTGGGAGMIAGSILFSVWGGPRRRALGLLGFHLAAMLLMIVPGVWPSLLPVTLATGGILACLAMINSSNYALLSQKVDPALQGRVFATVNAITIGTLPLGHLTAGPLADWSAALAGGQARGINWLFIAFGIGGVLLTVLGACYRPLRRVDDLPDMTSPPVADDQPAVASLASPSPSL
ncbi:MAG TPA: MFS transporter [Roseiflexaceae bacterium]|nr:MFS transporter [Roseiflexaceae bacterium]